MSTEKKKTSVKCTCIARENSALTLRPKRIELPFRSVFQRLYTHARRTTAAADRSVGRSVGRSVCGSLYVAVAAAAAAAKGMRVEIK